MTAETDLDDGLTAEERAALAEEDDTTTLADPGEGETNGQEEATKPSAGDTAADGQAADAAATTEAAAAPAAEPPADDGSTKTGTQPAPILVAQVSADTEARLSEIGTKKDALLEQFDAGDITAREYQKQLDALNKQERELEAEIREAKLAEKLTLQQQQNEWAATCAAFVNDHPIYKNNQRLYQALDAEVRSLAQKPESANWDGQKFLDEAHKNLKEAFGFQESAPTGKKPAAPRPDLPPNLAKVPAADVQDTNGGRFAVLDRLQATDPLGYEEALAKMSESERTAYLAAG